MEITALLLIFAVAALLWHRHRHKHELAIGFCKHACSNMGVQLLDDTVSLSRFRFCRNRHKKIDICRIYSFEYTTDRVTREKGHIVLIGRELDSIKLQGNIFMQ